MHTLGQSSETSNMPERMPVLFVGHGSPMNAIEDNEASRGWKAIAKTIPRPTAILCISAHWETWGTKVTAMPRPRTIHDFGGFPRPLYEAQYPALGDPALARQICELVKPFDMALDQDWGLDHGCWSVLKQMFPAAEIPVLQISLDNAQTPQAQYDLAKELAPLRHQGVLILGSGNIVHNLRRVVLRGNSLNDFNTPFGLDWALEASALFKQLIDEDRHAELADYQSLGSAVQLAVPTPEHYLPLLYALALKEAGESVTYFNDYPLAGALTMTSLVIQ